MKLIIFALCFAVTYARTTGGSSSSSGFSGDRFDPSDSGRRGSSSSGHDRDSGMNGGDQFPPFFRVEVEIQRLDNKNSIRSDGKNCNWFSKPCDPRVRAFLDAEKPLSPWPGSRPVKEWPIVFEASKISSPTITKSVNRDVCGGAVSKVNLRVNVEDVDVTSNDLIGTFECIFTVSPRDIATDAQSAVWGPSMECTAATQQGKIRLFARERVYEIPSSNCQATDSRLNTGSLVGGPGMKREGQHDFIRVDVELVQLLDPQGITFKKDKCDTCNPVISAYLDTDKPLAAWPGSKTVPAYTQIFSVSKQNSPIINKNVSTNICGGSVSQVNLRVEVVNNGWFSNSVIEDFECLFTADYRQVAADISSADWSSTQDCKPIHPGHDIRLQYRYRLYDIPPSACGIKKPGGSSGGLLSGIFGG